MDWNRLARDQPGLSFSPIARSAVRNHAKLVSGIVGQGQKQNPVDIGPRQTKIPQFSRRKLADVGAKQAAISPLAKPMHEMTACCLARSRCRNCSVQTDLNVGHGRFPLFVGVVLHGQTRSGTAIPPSSWNDRMRYGFDTGRRRSCGVDFTREERPCLPDLTGQSAP